MPETGELLQGKVIGGKFHLGRYLGGSERSAVFLTENAAGRSRTAAIKLIPADPATADLQLSRWTLISRLAHPHLLQIFETGRCRQDGEEMLYVVMEYAEENLAQILPHRSLTPDETHEMLKPVLEALAYLHGRGFVHGHLKPANILVAGEQVKLATDGICRVGEPEGAETGTYGPPDLPGTAASPSRDIWSLGVTLVQVLTQLLPVRNGGSRHAARDAAAAVCRFGAQLSAARSAEALYTGGNRRAACTTNCRRAQSALLRCRPDRAAFRRPRSPALREGPGKIAPPCLPPQSSSRWWR